MTKLDIIIVNWNGGEQLRACLASIERVRRERFRLGRVVVVDNESSDGSAENLDYPAIPLAVIRNTRNRGFAAACNQGAAGSGAAYLLFLNPDTLLREDSLDVPIAFMERPEGDGVGIVGVRLVDERGAASPSCARFPTLRTLLSKSLGLYRLSPRLFPTYAMTGFDCGRSAEVDYVSGAFFVVRRGAFEELGGFDERFFVYFEETDFSKRMRGRGLKSFFLAETEVYHRGGGASEQAKAHRLFYAAASRILYARKHLDAVSSAAFAALALTIEPLVRLAAALGSGSSANVRENARGYGMLYRALPRIARGRSVHGERT